MPKWRITAEFQPREEKSLFGKKVHKGEDPLDYTVHRGDLIDGVEDGDWIKTHFEGVSPDDVFIQILDHAELDAPLSPEPIRSDERDAFCVLVTTMARHYETDRNYLMAWAFLDTNNLQDLGQPGDGKIGPFQFSAEEWDAAIKGPAKFLNLSAQQRSGWRDQVPVAALVLKDCIQRLQSASATSELPTKLPTRLEVYFAQKFGAGAEEVLKQPRADRCRDRIKNAPAAGTYAGQLANSDKTIQQALDDLRAPLEGAFKAAHTLIDTQPPEIRFFDESDLPPAAGDAAPWLKVAIEQMNNGVTRDSGDKNTAQIQAYFSGTGTDPGPREPWCAAFVSYCMKNCGVAAVASSTNSVSPLAKASAWKAWGKPAPVPPPVGCVVVLKPQETGSSGHVGFLYELSDGKTVKLLAGNQKKHTEDHNHVGIVEFPVDGDKGVDSYRWLDVAPPAVAAGEGARASRSAMAARWDGKTGAGDWSGFVLDALEQHGAQLLDCVPSDIGDFCPAFPGDKAGRKRFWLFLLSCIAEFESSFKPDDKFTESTGEISAGLLQLSVGDGRNYSCEFSTLQDVFDPAKNLSCGVRIMQKLVVQDSVIAGGNNKGASRYWSTLRPNRPRKPLETIKQRCSARTF
jgi:uncharacterized protein (TIGR02594 family)